MIRFNFLRIYINANEAKPGGVIGAMLSPYLFSSNMSDFCKRFNEQSKDYLSSTIIPVNLFTDSIEKSYTFILKNLAFTMFLINYFNENILVNICFFFDLVLYYCFVYKLSLIKSSFLLFAVLKSLKKKVAVFQISTALLLKYNKLYV